MNYPIEIQRELYASEQTYHQASAMVKSKQMKDYFSRVAGSKQKFRKEIEIEDQSMDTKVFKEGKIDFESQSVDEILAQCINEEESLIREYQKAITTSNIDGKYHKIVLSQLNSALTVFNQMRAKKLSESYSN